jgi:hypothetical protein
MILGQSSRVAEQGVRVREQPKGQAAKKAASKKSAARRP